MDLRGALSRRIRRLRHRGDAVQCTCCGRSWGSFAPAWNRANAICPGCGSHERHRALCLYLAERTPLGDEPMSLLHFAPEHALRGRMEAVPGLRYVTADLDPEGVDVQLDITAMPFEDGAFDAILCSHVLEHVADDRAAMSELHRVLKPGGWATVLVPLDLSREITYEDFGVTAPEDRVREFGQHDHVRMYAPDIVQRLEGVGFDVVTDRFVEKLGEDRCRRHGLLAEDLIFRCTRPSS
ncbi:MAG TPA: class I SAM-dependent methyltransferase [Thermoleophilaceae bacterium]|nr:class I SAM-dependent methyltransferase [Thermoleophilaceae bacterium]